jgi:hypothetical protein
VPFPSAIEAMIGHMKTNGHLGRCSPKGDAAKVILSAVGCNLQLVLTWLRILPRLILLALAGHGLARSNSTTLSNRPFAGSPVIFRDGLAVSFQWVVHPVLTEEAEVAEASDSKGEPPNRFSD